MPRSSSYFNIAAGSVPAGNRRPPISGSPAPRGRGPRPRDRDASRATSRGGGFSSARTSTGCTASTTKVRKAATASCVAGASATATRAHRAGHGRPSRRRRRARGRARPQPPWGTSLRTGYRCRERDVGHPQSRRDRLLGDRREAGAQALAQLLGPSRLQPHARGSPRATPRPAPAAPVQGGRRSGRAGRPRRPGADPRSFNLLSRPVRPVSRNPSIRVRARLNRDITVPSGTRAPVPPRHRTGPPPPRGAAPSAAPRAGCRARRARRGSQSCHRVGARIRHLLQRFRAEIGAAPAPAPDGGQEQVALDREQPRPQVAVAATPGPSGQCPLQGVLDEVVRRFAIPKQRDRVAPQGRDLRFDQGGDLVQRRVPIRRSRSGHSPIRAWRLCHAPLRKPSPVVSPGLVSLARCRAACPCRPTDRAVVPGHRRPIAGGRRSGGRRQGRPVGGAGAVAHRLAAHVLSKV